jgi:hypothetical protein
MFRLLKAIFKARGGALALVRLKPPPPLYKNQETYSTKGEPIHKTIQKHRIHRIENKNTKQKT